MILGTSVTLALAGVYKQILKHLQGFQNLAGARFIACTMRYENDSSLLAPGGVASFADGVRQQRYSGSREESCGKDRSCALNAMNNSAVVGV
jgi:hypothetical protein